MSERDTDYFHREVASFLERYAPRGGYGREFEHELRMLLSLAFREAQKPFVYELNQYRDTTMKTAMLTPRIVPLKNESQTSMPTPARDAAHPSNDSKG